MFLSPRYDDPKPTPPFHRTAWALYCSDLTQAGCVAPRDHAKSTALTFDYVLAEVLFRCSDYVIIIGSTEEMAAEQLSNISEELHQNDELRTEFRVKDFESDQKTELICVMEDGYRFRILARGAEQKIRGRLWKGKRPNLIVCDDIEDDEQVESRERRAKFRRWFFRAAKQALSKSGKMRIHGTILHDDSLLARLQRNKMWKFLFYKAHKSFDDFSEILWPERWNEPQLKARRQEFIEDGDSAGYSQEFLNTPRDNADAYLKSDNFIGMEEEEYLDEVNLGNNLIVCAAADLAVSKADLANRTSFTIAGKHLNNKIYFIDQYVDRWSSGEWIDEMFAIQEKWSPQFFWVEDGVIWKAVADMVYREMEDRDIYINIVPVPSIKDKATKGRPLQRRHKARALRFDKKAEWYPSFEEELLKFVPGVEGRLDDQFDSAALLVAGFETMPKVEAEDLMTEEEEEFEFHRRQVKVDQGRSQVTGY